MRKTRDRLANKDGLEASTIVSGTCIPLRSPRVSEQVQCRQLVDTEKKRGNKRCNKSVDSDAVTRRVADKARRSSMSQNERDQILETRHAAYQMRRPRVSDATNEEHGAGTSDFGTDSERKNKRPLEMDQLPEHHIKDRGKSVRIGGNNDEEAGTSSSKLKQQ
ncbi:hypothetical protein MKW98_016741 [Papaver atlanticum]|uniref:Uncharacterized protein n=1 Tax=Papaver atlanticum TaxID=357466 RepID=A0AAD4TJ71_9MAGN|nr:hypothetical protein MKW98_016741 [Papaver atlanticum]